LAVEIIPQRTLRSVIVNSLVAVVDGGLSKPGWGDAPPLRGFAARSDLSQNLPTGSRVKWVP
jgi:hypothetical protein